jgi:hypothetical protein
MIRTFFIWLVLTFMFLPAEVFPIQQAQTSDDNAVPITADHSKFPILQKKFNKAPEVTEACLRCHTEAANQIMATIHWTWVCPKSQEGNVGKKNENIYLYEVQPLLALDAGLIYHSFGSHWI